MKVCQNNNKAGLNDRQALEPLSNQSQSDSVLTRQPNEEEPASATFKQNSLLDQSCVTLGRGSGVPIVDNQSHGIDETVSDRVTHHAVHQTQKQPSVSDRSDKEVQSDSN